MRNQSELVMIITGHITFLTRQEIWTEIGKVEHQRILNDEKSIRLDSIPCSVLPNCIRAYAVKCRHQGDKDFVGYWRFVHGIVLTDEKLVFEVSFAQGDETMTLSYPSKCVLQVMPFREGQMRKYSGKVDEFQKQFTKEVQDVIDIIGTEMREGSHWGDIE